MTAPGNPFEHLHIRLEYKRRMAVIKAVLQKPHFLLLSSEGKERERERERDGEEGGERDYFGYDRRTDLCGTCKLADKCHITKHSLMNQREDVFGDTEACSLSEG